MWGKKTVSVIIPASKKQESIFDVIQEYDSTGYVDEVIVVDNGIYEETESKIKKTRARLVKKRIHGYARSIRSGIKNTKAELIIVTDANGFFKGKDVLKLLAYSDDFDMVFGSRTHKPLIEADSGMNFLRCLVDDIFGKLITLLFLSSSLTDVGCVLRLTNRKAWAKVNKECTIGDELFLTQWLINAAKNKVRFIEVPVNYRPSSSSSYSDSFIFQFVRAVRIFFSIWSTRLFGLR